MGAVKAYEVRSEETAAIVFEKSSIAARRIGAGELNVDFDEVESCNRRPAFDQYAPGPVPFEVLMACGWSTTCWNCERRIHSDMEYDLEEEELDPAWFGLVERDSMTYCSLSCAAEKFARQRRRARAQADFTEWVHTFFPGSQVNYVHVYDDVLIPDDKPRTYAAFTYPGCTGVAEVAFPHPDTRKSVVSVLKADLEAFYKAYPERRIDR